jgi:hypothetical protein
VSDLQVGEPMKRITFATIVALSLASPFSRSSRAAPPPEAPIAPVVVQAPESYPNLVRVGAGVSTYNSGWYNCYFYPYYVCGPGSYTSYVPFTVGAQVDIHLRREGYLTPGFQVMTGSVSANYFDGVQQVETSNHVTLWEPSVDYVAKLGPQDQETTGRLRLGGALYFGSDGNWGGGFRIGAGVSFFNTQRFGLGLDFVFEGASYNGYWLGGLQLLVSPEIHF